MFSSLQRFDLSLISHPLVSFSLNSVLSNDVRTSVSNQQSGSQPSEHSAHHFIHSYSVAPSSVEEHLPSIISQLVGGHDILFLIRLFRKIQENALCDSTSSYISFLSTEIRTEKPANRTTACHRVQNGSYRSPDIQRRGQSCSGHRFKYQNQCPAKRRSQDPCDALERLAQDRPFLDLVP